jgi:hypothetical protein
MREAVNQSGPSLPADSFRPGPKGASVVDSNVSAQPRLPRGRYEQLIDTDAANAIDHLTDLEASNRPLDTSESADVLTGYLAGRVRRALRSGEPQEHRALIQELLDTLGRHEVDPASLVDLLKMLEGVQLKPLPGQDGIPAPLTRPSWRSPDEWPASALCQASVIRLPRYRPGGFVTVFLRSAEPPPAATVPIPHDLESSNT